MKKYFPLLLLLIAFLTLTGISACNSQKKAAEKAEADAKKRKQDDAKKAADAKADAARMDALMAEAMARSTARVRAMTGGRPR